ncbi:MAG: response regulator [Oculatellaceae cyanobacterium bins.114]|nr:response regulator [Oculatellaceae cyanobacterium bins.114]
MRILLVDDDEIFIQALAQKLTAQHYAVDIALDGEMGWSYAQFAVYDLIVLDINLPKLDGIGLCQQLRRNKYSNSILLLTAKGNSSDKVMGLDAGADDYVVKPCPIEEICAHIRALLRRQTTPSTPILEWGRLRLDPGTCEVVYQEQLLTLSPKEYGLLELFLRNPQRVFSSSSILEHLWGFDDVPGEETVRTHIKRLRRKLKSAGADDLIDTVYGMGYRLKPIIEQPSSAAIATDQNSNQARTAAIAVWEKFKPPMLERVAVLEEAVTALKVGYLPDEVQQAALRAAHKLAGSLGMFGFPNGTEISRDIERWLQRATQTSHFMQLQALVTQLQQELQKPPKPSAWDVDLLSDSQEQGQDQNGLTNGLTAPTMSLSPGIAQPGAVTQPESVVLSQKRSPQINVLAIDDDPAILETLQQILLRWGIQCSSLSDPGQLWSTLETVTPDLLILDVDIPNINGIDLCRTIRNDATWSHLPILFLSVYRDAETIVKLYSAGADDYVAKPFTEPEIVTRIFNRLERTRMRHNVAGFDPLTGVANWQSSTQVLNRYINLAQQQQQPLCVAVIKLGQIAQVNYQHGHEVGDAVLKQVAATLQQSFSERDIVARWGGAEFLVGMYGIHQQEALERLKQLLHRVRHEIALVVDVTHPLQLSFSAGVAEAPQHGLDLQSLYQLASAAMQQVVDANEQGADE